jgi:hypothetical protein
LVRWLKCIPPSILHLWLVGVVITDTVQLNREETITRHKDEMDKLHGKMKDIIDKVGLRNKEEEV